MGKRSSLIIALLITTLMFGLSNPAFGAVTVEFQAGTAAGWDYYALDGDIVKNNVVDLNDLNIIATQWLDGGCGDANQWCGGADIDGSTDVDFIDYAMLAKDWTMTGAENVLLQTIYGTEQDPNGTIIANTYKALQNFKGIAVAFNVPTDTALDKAIFKLRALTAGRNIQVRFYNVTDKGYLLVPGHPAPTRIDPGLGGQLLFNTGPNTIPTPAPSHLEGTVSFSDMIINFGPMEVTAGDYLLVFDYIKEGTLSTACSFVQGVGATISAAMGTYPDGSPLPKSATVSSTGFTGNTYYYNLSSIDDADYSSASNLFACQIRTTVVNHTPIVSAGISQTIAHPNDTANLDGTVSDDGNPAPPGALTTIWSKVSGPGTVTFDDANAVDTTATFSEFGTYVLRLTAYDGELTELDDVQIIYKENSAPVVNAGIDLTVGILDTTNLDATVTDDGLPTPPAAVTTLWTKTSGPGTATFGNTASVDTTVTFSATGIYVLRLDANDSELSDYDEATIEVVSGSLNSAPVVDAGVDKTIMVPQSSVSLNGTVTDDGRPIPPGAVTTTWTKESGSGTVTFGNIHNVDTSAAFSVFGTYVLRLTATDGSLQIYDEVTIIYKDYSYEGYDANNCTGSDIGTCTVSGLTTGGNNGTVVHVTNLNDSGAGSLRAAIASANGGTPPGTKIVFDVSGTIFTTSWLQVLGPYVTIAGETAPGAGITIDGSNCNDSGGTFHVNGHDMIFRHLRIRNNGSSDREIVQCAGDWNLIFDHLSVSNVSDLVGDGLLDINEGTDNVIISRCLFANGIEGSRSYGNFASIHHNLYYRINRRTPKIVNSIGPYDFRNNVLQYWTGSGTNVEAGHQVNIINNYWGPTDKTCGSGFNYDPVNSANVYIAGNYFTCGTDINGLGDKATPNEEPPVSTMPADDNLRDNVKGDCGAMPRDAYDYAIAGPAS